MTQNLLISPHHRDSRRGLLRSATAGLVTLPAAPALAKGADSENNVTATEDLMREHGILRRTLVVYSEVAFRLRSTPASVDLSAIRDAATLFKYFGEDYHEKRLEEEIVFPAAVKMGGEVGQLVQTLKEQHDRGRLVTAYILHATSRQKLAEGDAGALANAMESMARMYRAHASREDTILLPAWKQTMSPSQSQAMAETFERIEHESSTREDFEKAEADIGSVEKRLGLTDLAQFTAPDPPQI